mmetsp:Transcript_2072/g.2704  ORF Transcript_2072/g.2704 Transcript_2072/m.2704 type:complete len:178 (-) Transcript_2072:95-628(-)
MVFLASVWLEMWFARRILTGTTAAPEAEVGVAVAVAVAAAEGAVGAAVVGVVVAEVVTEEVAADVGAAGTAAVEAPVTAERRVRMPAEVPAAARAAARALLPDEVEAVRGRRILLAARAGRGKAANVMKAHRAGRTLAIVADLAGAEHAGPVIEEELFTRSTPNRNPVDAVSLAIAP